MYDTAGVRRTVPPELADKFPEFFRATDAEKLARASCFPASFHEWLKNKPRKPHTDLRVKSSGALSNVSENDLGQALLAHAALVHFARSARQYCPVLFTDAFIACIICIFGRRPEVVPSHSRRA